MRINKETFIEDYIKLSTAQYEIQNIPVHVRANKSVADFKADIKEGNKMSDRLAKMTDFLARDSVFAKETLDKFIEICDDGGTIPKVMAGVAGILWNFNYRMIDCHRLFKKALGLMPDTDFYKVHIEVIYSNIVNNNPYFKRRREFPKLE